MDMPNQLNKNKQHNHLNNNITHSMHNLSNNNNFIKQDHRTLISGRARTTIIQFKMSINFMGNEL